jgi:hypothetical protein
MGGASLAGVEVYAMNTTTLDVASETTDQAGNYNIGSSSEGGLPAGSYRVYTSGVSTANPALVPVVLSRFEATPGPDGTVIEWTTASETNHAGFLIERASAVGGVRATLTDRLVTGGPSYRFVDADPPAGDAWYWLVAVDRAGRQERFGPVAATGKPAELTRLLGPAANPSRKEAVIRWSLARPQHVSLRLYDAGGRLVRTLVDEVRPAGSGSIVWDGRGDRGVEAAAGLYFIRFETPEGIQKTRVVLTD